MMHQDCVKPIEEWRKAPGLSIIEKILADLHSFALETDNPEAKQLYQDQATKLQNMMDKVRPYLRG